MNHFRVNLHAANKKNPTIALELLDDILSNTHNDDLQKKKKNTKKKNKYPIGPQ
jgi:hypothetical protein